MALFQTNVLDPQIKALPTVDTASGSIATFDTDMTENLVEVKCQIVAQQSGSGTPSPSNPRPITTFSEMNVVATGKNFINVPDTTVSVANYVFNYSDLNIPKGTYTFSYDTDYTGGVSLAVGGDNGDYYNGAISGVKTIYASDKITKIRLYTSGAGTFSNIQFEQGDRATTYEPFNGTTANIPFGQTVAQGVLNVTTGKLSFTWVDVDLGTLAWTVYNAGNNIFAVSVSGKANGVDNLLCEQYANYTGALNNMPDLSIRGEGSANILYIRNTNCTTDTDIITALSGVKCIYELVTPQEIQLDSITLQALLNENNIWCDTGDAEVKFLLSVGKKIS